MFLPAFLSAKVKTESHVDVIFTLASATELSFRSFSLFFKIKVYSVHLVLTLPSCLFVCLTGGRSFCSLLSIPSVLRYWTDYRGLLLVIGGGVHFGLDFKAMISGSKHFF
jgi:hypothetical protein